MPPRYTGQEAWRTRQEGSRPICSPLGPEGVGRTGDARIGEQCGVAARRTSCRAAHGRAGLGRAWYPKLTPPGAWLPTACKAELPPACCVISVRPRQEAERLNTPWAESLLLLREKRKVVAGVHLKWPQLSIYLHSLSLRYWRLSPFADWIHCLGIVASKWKILRIPVDFTAEWGS